MPFDEQAAIEDFWNARARGEYFPAQWFDRLTLDEAYRIQLGVIARRIAAGERQIGWKVGLTAVPIQQQFGFHEPVFGCILESRPSGHVFRRDELIRPGFEPELCLRVGQALSGEVDVPTVRRAIDAVYPALEIIETRGDSRRRRSPSRWRTTRSRRPWCWASRWHSASLALDAVAATVRINGETVATGRGDAVLGNPLNSVVWLARKLKEFGRGIRGGRDHHERLVHAAVPDRAGRSGGGGFRRRGRGADGDAGVGQFSEARALSLRIPPRPSGRHALDETSLYHHGPSTGSRGHRLHHGGQCLRPDRGLAACADPADALSPDMQHTAPSTA